MMAISKGKSDSGQGGKRGHSNMDHWEFTEEIKRAAKKRRRLAAKTEIKLGRIEFEREHGASDSRPPLQDELS
jgi:hypothetical protein